MKTIPEIICGKDVAVWDSLNNTARGDLYKYAYEKALPKLGAEDYIMIGDCQVAIVGQEIRNLGETGALELIAKLGIFLAGNPQALKGLE